MEPYEYLTIGGGVALYALVFCISEIRRRRKKRSGTYHSGGYASIDSGGSDSNGCD